MVFRGYDVGQLAKRTFKEIGDDRVLGLAAQAAYYFFFSLFPILLFLAPLLGVIGDKQENFNWVVGQLRQAVPGEASALIDNVVRSVVFAEGAPGLISTGALLAVWAGSNVFGALMDSLNEAYDVKETRPWWKRKLIAVASVFGIGGTILLTSVVFIAGDWIVGWMGDHMGLAEQTQQVWAWARIPISFAMLVGLAWLSFFFLPNIRQSKRHVLAGAVLTTVLWVLVTLLFRFYVQNFANYNATYGTIGGVIALLTWMYFSMVVFLVGGELNSELHRGTGQVEPRTARLYGDRIATAEQAGVPSTSRVRRLDPLHPRGA